jgi:hypothetical protein
MPSIFLLIHTEFLMSTNTQTYQVQTAHTMQKRGLCLRLMNQHFLTEISGFFIMMWTAIENV